MSYNLFLDDYRNPNEFLKDTRTWEVVRNYDEFVRMIERRGLPQFISWDHDLSFEDQNKTVGFIQKTGYDCACWLIEYCMRTEQSIPEYQIHSMNRIGRIRIHELLSRHQNKTQTLNE